MRMEKTPPSVRRAPPAHAADTIEILRELGLTPAQIDALAETGGIRAADAARRTRKTG
jgi:crotonobetainyl-CoA:carnitine CoA-transferase CaiB-like acyl-CoA transferase